MRQKPNSCMGCSCADHGTDFSAIEGTGSSGVMLVGEASGEHEQRDGLPFRPHAPAGGVLTRIIRQMGLSREQFSITNVVRCRPRHNWLEKSPWEYSAINQCRSNLDAAIAERRPRVIVALGGIATRELTGMAGDAQGVGHLAGYVLPWSHSKYPWGEVKPYDSNVPSGTPQEYPIPVIPNFHPAYLRRGKMSHAGVFARILQRAMNVAKGSDRGWLWGVDPEQERTHGSLRYCLHPSLDAARNFVQRVTENGGLTLSYDIETFESASLDEDAREGFTDTQIRLVQFSVRAGEGIAFPWDGEYRHLAGQLLRSPNTKCGHNVWLFDNKVLRAAGEREGLDLIPRGVIHDTLQMFHHWQPDLPAHLQFAAGFVSFPFPWKHLAASDLEFYGCCDVDATLRLYTMLAATLRRDQLWGDHDIGYVGQVMEVRPVLEAMELRGMPIDDAARVELGIEFEKAQTALGAELSKLAPKECCRVHPKDKGYVGVPPEVKKWIEVHPADWSSWNYIPDRFTESGDDPEGYHYEQRTFDVPDDNLKLVPTERWCRVYDFNPNSRNQVLDYMRHMKHPIPKSKEEDDEGNRKDTTNEKELRRLAVKMGDDFYLKVIEYRGYAKMRGTYVDGFAPQADGCVHTTFTFDTGIGQLSCCAGYTPVSTQRGKVIIGNVRIGDMVWTHRERWRRVTNRWFFPPQPMVNVYLSNGKVLTCTASHKLLLSFHEHKQEVAFGREYLEGSILVPQQGSSDAGGDSRAVRDQNYERVVGAEASDASSGTQGASKAALLTVEGGQEEPAVRENRRAESQLDWNSERWVRVSDLLSGGEESLRASSCDGEGAWLEGASKAVRGASHQRQYRGQSVGQPSLSDERRPQVYTLTSTNRGEVITIEKIVPVGCLSVYDITVEEDESYESCGVFSHNSRNPNVQNFPKLKPTVALAKAMRRMVAAPDGQVITEWDFKSCHVITLGFLAEDLNYMRLGRLDIHSFVAGHFLNLWDGAKIFSESDEQLLSRFKELKKNPDWKRVRDDQAKHGILGIGNGLKAKGLYERYMESFPPAACQDCGGTGKVAGVRGTRKCASCKGIGRTPGARVAERVLDVCEALFPNVFDYQKREVKTAHEQQFLKSPFGHIRRFYEVFRWDPRRADWAPGDQHEEAVAYRLANIAFGHIREKLKDLRVAGMDARYGLFNNVHDSFLFKFPEKHLERHIADVYPILTAPSRVLKHPTIAPDGLVIGVEGSWGHRWSEMREMELRTAVSR